MFERELQVGLSTVRQAAQLCRAVQGTMIDGGALAKEDKSPVTVADFGSQAIICKGLGEAFANDPVIGEEGSATLRQPEQAVFLDRIEREVQQVLGTATRDEICRWIDRGGARDYSPRFWTLDPIDGTKGFLRKEQYAISLALLIEGRIEVAVLGCPNLLTNSNGETSRGALFYAVRGQGAWMQSFDGQEPARRMHVSATSDPRQARFCESVEAGHSAQGRSAAIAARLGITTEPVRLDSQAKYGVVARGEAELYLRLPTKADYHEQIWDHAGGVLVVEEAGGRVTDILGKPLEFQHGQKLSHNHGVLGSNGHLHDALVAAVAATA